MVHGPFKKHLGAHFYSTKIFLELFKTCTGAFYLDFNNKEIKNEFFKILESFIPRAGMLNSSFKKGISKVIKYLKGNYFGHRARFPAKYWDYRDLVLAEKFQFSTNAIESLNRSIKHFLGLGYLDLNKLDSQMNRFHSQKKVEATDGLKHGELNSKRRETILRENNIFDILKKFESLAQSEKIASLQFHLLEIGTLTKKTLSPEYFNCLPPLTEIETEQTEPSICINVSSFLDETVCSVPDLEEIPNPDSTDYPSFLGQNYENRDCTRVLRSNVSKSSFHPLHSM